MWWKGQKEMKTFKITSTAGHGERIEQYNGTLVEFMLAKFGSRGAMEDQGCSIEEVEVPAEEVKPKAKRKSADAE